MEAVKAKKHLGQHFLKDEDIALSIVQSLTHFGNYKKVLEIGPGMGVLTKYLIQEKNYETFVIDIDTESIEYLHRTYPQLSSNIISADFLRMDVPKLFPEPFAIIGNFPYNISSQILFKVLDHKDLIPEVVGMFQKEVAERLASVPRKKAYGILSVFLQAFYTIEYLFTVNADVFIPVPKVKSAVIRLKRNDTKQLACDHQQFIKIVKAGFNQRRKVMRNSLKSFTFKPGSLEHVFFTQRAEELSVNEFVELTNMLQGG